MLGVVKAVVEQGYCHPSTGKTSVVEEGNGDLGQRLQGEAITALEQLGAGKRRRRRWTGPLQALHGPRCNDKVRGLHSALHLGRDARTNGVEPTRGKAHDHLYLPQAFDVARADGQV